MVTTLGSLCIPIVRLVLVGGATSRFWVQRGHFEGDVGVFIGGIDQGVPETGCRGSIREMQCIRASNQKKVSRCARSFDFVGHMHKYIRVYIYIYIYIHMYRAPAPMPGSHTQPHPKS